jgi:hypothetical protein
MARPLTRTQALENRAFLKVLQRTGNVRLACREVGVKYGTMQDRRKKHPGFALKWEAALVGAAARFAKGLGPRFRGDDEGPSTIGSSADGPPPSAGIPPVWADRRSLEARSAHANSGRNEVVRVAPCASRPVCSPLRPAKYRTKKSPLPPPPAIRGRIELAMTPMCPGAGRGPGARQRFVWLTLAN